MDGIVIINTFLHWKGETKILMQKIHLLYCFGLIMKINTKKWCVSILSLIGVVGIVLMSGCVQNPELQNSGSPIPPLSTTPVSQGYIQSFDNNLNYGFEYPETWEMHSPDEFSYTNGVKKVDMFTKPSEATSITIIVKTSIWKDTNEAKSVWQEAFKESITNENDLNLNNLKGYEITRDDSGTKSKMAIFIIGGMAYEFDYGGADNETSFKASEIIFDHVVNSFNVK